MNEAESRSAVANESLVDEAESLVLPADFDAASYAAAVELDQLHGGQWGSDDPFRAGMMTHRDKVLSHLYDRWRDRPPFTLAWPSSLYIPAEADWKPYWIVPPPDDHRYAFDWAPTPSLAGYNEASREQGTLYCIQRIRTIDRYVQAEAGLGVLFTPTRTLSVVSLQPRVNCSGEHRWFAEFGTEGFSQVRVAGSTQVKTSLILAAWQQIPGSTGWDLLHWKQFAVSGNGPTSGSGHAAITPYQRSFSGAELATPFLVEAARTYLLGVVARVSVWSTLTDDRGQPLPLIEDGTFRVWGSLACAVPQIEVVEQQIYIA